MEILNRSVLILLALLALIVLDGQHTEDIISAEESTRCSLFLEEFLMLCSWGGLFSRLPQLALSMTIGIAIKP